MNWLTRLNLWAQRTHFLPRARRSIMRIPPQRPSQFIDATKRAKTRAVP